MKRHLLRIAVAVSVAAPFLPSPAFGQLNLPPSFGEPCKKCCGYDCADSCSNKPFEPTNCKTTDYGAARADIVIGANALASTNMLYCPGGTTSAPQPYALCFFSGPPTATGVPGSANKTLKCTPDLAKGVANCQCQVYNTGAYYVAINSILNQGAFWETQGACGHDGSKCKNIAACDENGNQKTSCGANPCPTCPDQIAPVCKYVAAQPFDKDLALYPKDAHAPESRVDLISTFSFAMGTTSSSGPYQLGSTPCTNGIYAGCMTAPCAYAEGGDKSNGSIVNCACPLWQGDYQIGQPKTDLQSSMICPSSSAGWVWSAANAVAAPTKP